jgi:hypothetical protein
LAVRKKDGEDRKPLACSSAAIVALILYLRTSMQLVRHILWSEEDLNYEGPSLLFLEDYIDSLLEYGLFRRDELPPPALELYDLSHYEREVMNGGHAQYLGNLSRWRKVPGTIADSCLSGLRALPNSEYHDIYSALCGRLAEDRERASSIASTHGFSDLGTGYVDLALKQLDGRFFAINKDYALGRLNVARLKRLESLRPVPSTSFLNELVSQIVSNPYRAERRSAKALDRFCWIHHFDPHAIESLCHLAGRQFIHSVIGGRDLEIDGQPTYGHVIETDSGRCFICFRLARQDPRPLYSYRNDPLYLYSFPGKDLLSGSAR